MKLLLISLISLPTLCAEYKFPRDFKFGVSNASAQVEDQLNDSWMEFAKAGKTKAFLNHYKPEEKIQFWSKPEIEIKLAKQLGVKVFRMSLDWHRLVPKEGAELDEIALERYLTICKMIREEGMQVMMTHFHHSLPAWAIKIGGWTNPKLIKYFADYAFKATIKLKDHVDYWITFNEPNVYAMFSYVAGIWPPGKKNVLAALKIPYLYEGDFFKAIKNMANAHKLYYSNAKSEKLNIFIGIAHNTANYKESGFLSSFSKNWSWENMNYLFADLVKDNLDFMGFNYYGAEYMTLSSIELSPKAEYNDAGRAFDPNGLYDMIKLFYNRYKLPIFITENGTADEEDFFRGSYLIEHLLAIHKAISEKIPILGYIQWSLSDNFEWSDGYCPKFGLVAVDRKNGFKRMPRESYYLYQSIITEYKITTDMREKAWEKVKGHFNKNRSICRAENAEDALDQPRQRKFSPIDWRFKK